LSGPKGKVFAFEPSPGNIPRLKKHLQINHCNNVQVLELALSDHEGIARFDNQAGSGTGHLSPEGRIEVQITSLDAVSTRLPAPKVMKIDCEGAEVEVLKGGEKIIRAADCLVVRAPRERKAPELPFLPEYAVAAPKL